MNRENFLTIPEVAKLLGVSRIAVYKQVKRGQLHARKIGRNYLIPKPYILHMAGHFLNEKDKRQIDLVVKRAFKQYGEALKRLGKE